MQTKGILSLVATILLCLPSLIGAIAVFTNVLFQQHIAEWGMLSSLVVATAVFIGAPLVVLAAVVSVVVGLRRGVAQEVKLANYTVVFLAVLATFSLTFHFGMR